MHAGTVAAALVVTACPAVVHAAYPTATITNGELTATLALPDAEHGYYRGTRFDHSGIVTSLAFAGHELITPWSEVNDPNVADYEYRGDQIATGINTTMVGVPEEFGSSTRTAQGFEEAAPGGHFLKIGVGLLRRPDDKPYDHYRLYDVLQGGWHVSRQRSAVSFRQRVDDAASGYGYLYAKKVSLVHGMARMKIEHVLRNTGRRPISGFVFDHNFTRWDNQTPGPDWSMRFAFDPQPVDVPGDAPLGFAGRTATFRRALQGRESMRVVLKGYPGDPAAYDFRFENRRLDLGLRVTADQPLWQLVIWGNRAVFAIEPFIHYEIAPGAEYRWTYDYDIYQP